MLGFLVLSNAVLVLEKLGPIQFDRLFRKVAPDKRSMIVHIHIIPV